MTRGDQTHEQFLAELRAHHLEPEGEAEQRRRAEAAERELDELRAALTGDFEELADELILVRRRAVDLERANAALERRCQRAESSLALIVRTQEAAERAREARRMGQSELLEGVAGR